MKKVDLSKAHAWWAIAEDGTLALDEAGVPWLFKTKKEAKSFLVAGLPALPKEYGSAVATLPYMRRAVKTTQ